MNLNTEPSRDTGRKGLSDFISKGNGYVAFLMHCYPAGSKRLTDIQRSSRRRTQASLHLNCVSTSLKQHHLEVSGLVCTCMCIHMHTAAPCKNCPDMFRLAAPLRGGKKEGKTVMQ